MNPRDRELLNAHSDAGTWVRAAVVRICQGDGSTAIYLSQMIYWYLKATDPEHQMHHPEGWFRTQHTRIEKQTGLGRTSQVNARKHLKRLGLIEEKHAGLPRALFQRLNSERFIALLTQQNADGDTVSTHARTKENADARSKADTQACSSLSTQACTTVEPEKSPRDTPSGTPENPDLGRAPYIDRESFKDSRDSSPPTPQQGEGGGGGAKEFLFEAIRETKLTQAKAQVAIDLHDQMDSPAVVVDFVRNHAETFRAACELKFKTQTDTGTFAGWLQEFHDHIQQHGPEAVEAAVKETWKTRLNVKSGALNFYRGKLRDQLKAVQAAPQSLTPQVGGVIASPEDIQVGTELIRRSDAKKSTLPRTFRVAMLDYTTSKERLYYDAEFTGLTFQDAQENYLIREAP